MPTYSCCIVSAHVSEQAQEASLKWQMGMVEFSLFHVGAHALTLRKPLADVIRLGLSSSSKVFTCLSLTLPIMCAMAARGYPNCHVSSPESIAVGLILMNA